MIRDLLTEAGGAGALMCCTERCDMICSYLESREVEDIDQLLARKEDSSHGKLALRSSLIKRRGFLPQFGRSDHRLADVLFRADWCCGSFCVTDSRSCGKIWPSGKKEHVLPLGQLASENGVVFQFGAG